MTIRCEWTGNDPLMIEYHDDEWGETRYTQKAEVDCPATFRKVERN